MADNVAVTAGSGTTVHADEYTHSTLGSGKTQLVKLVDGTLDSSTAITAGGGVEAGALRVTIASDSTGVLSVDDNGSSLTVDGTVAATQSGTWNVTNVSGTVSLPTGASTLAEQQTQTTALQLIDDTIKTLGTDTYTEATTKGSVIGAVRRDADTTLVDTTNEVAPLQVDANGRLKVEAFSGEALPVTLTSTTVTGTVAVTQSGTWDEVGINDSGNSITVDGTVAVTGVATETTLGSLLTSSQLIDDTVFTDDTSTHATGTTKGLGIMAAAAPTDTAVNANDIGMVGMTANRALYTSVQDALPAGTNAIGKLAANTGVDIGDVDITSIAAGDNNIGNVDIVSGTITTVSTVTALGAGTTGPMKAEDVAHATGDQGFPAWGVSNEANTARAADGDYIPLATDTEGNVRVVGNRDHDAVNAGEVLATGGEAIAHGTNPTAVAAADRTKWYFNRAGVPFVIGGHPNIVTFEAAYTAAQTDTAIVTIGTSTKIVVTEIEALCDNANTVDVGVRVGFGATTTPTTTGVVLTHPGIAAGSGVVRGAGAGILGVGADGEDLRITCEVPTTGSIRILVSYYTIES